MVPTIAVSTHVVITSGIQIRSPVMKYFLSDLTRRNQLQAQEPVPPWQGGGLSDAGAFAVAGFAPPLKSV